MIGIGIGSAPVGIGRFGAECTPVTSAAPNQPTIYAGTITSTTWNLSSSVFSDPDQGDTHLNSDWQVTTAADTGFASPVWQSLADASNKTAVQATGLTGSTAYIARVRHRDGQGNVSAYSSTVADTTLASGGVSPFFEDNFETGNFTKTGGGFSWTINSSNVAVTTDNPRGTDTYSAAFTYGPTPIGEHNWNAEKRFLLGASYTEIWVEYYLFVPANYYHRIPLPSNNKFFRLHEDDPYGFHITTETESTAAQTPAGTSYFRRFLAATRGASGNLYDMPKTPNIIGPDYPIKPGYWTQMRFHFKSASARDVLDGVAEWWADGVPIVTKTWDFWTESEGNDGGNPGRQAFVTGGYIIGWSNSSFTDETVFNIANWKVYSSNPGWT